MNYLCMFSPVHTLITPHYTLISLQLFFVPSMKQMCQQVMPLSQSSWQIAMAAFWIHTVSCVNYADSGTSHLFPKAPAVLTLSMLVWSAEQRPGCLLSASVVELLKRGCHGGTQKRSHRSTKLKKVTVYIRRTCGSRGGFLSNFILPKWRRTILTSFELLAARQERQRQLERHLDINSETS